MAHKDVFRYFREDYVGHSKSSAYLLAILSYYVYEGNVPRPGTFSVAFKNFFTELSITDPFNFEIYLGSWLSPFTDTQVAILSNSQIVLVVFRGSEGLTGVRDWLNNFQHNLMRSPTSWGGQVLLHHGFYSALNAVYPNIRSIVKTRRNKSQKIFLAGHSLGGALATLCAYRLQKVDKVPVTGVYVWGIPRVGDQNWSADYFSVLGSKTYRWVKNKDFASNLPIVGPYLSPHGTNELRTYYHVGELNYIKANGQVEMDRADFVYGVGPSSLDDHDMSKYCKKMYTRLSTDKRSSDTNPPYLVQGDVPSGGLF